MLTLRHLAFRRWGERAVEGNDADEVFLGTSSDELGLRWIEWVDGGVVDWKETVFLEPLDRELFGPSGR